MKFWHLPFLFLSTHLLQLQLNDLFLEGISFVLPLHVSLFHAILLSTEKKKKQRKESALLGLRSRYTNPGTPVQKEHLTNPLTHRLDASSNQSPGALRKEIIKPYLCIIDLSYSSPSGVFMMANSSRVTWHRAGFSIDAEIVLMSCGSTLPGESRDRDPTAFMDDYQKNKGKNIIISFFLNCLQKVHPVEVPHVMFQFLILCSVGTQILNRILLSCWYTFFPLKFQLLFTRDVLFEPAFSPPFRQISFLIHQLVLNSSRKLSCSKMSPKTNKMKAQVYDLVLRSTGSDPGQYVIQMFGNEVLGIYLHLDEEGWPKTRLHCH